jgi:hypothetical protein
MRQSNEPMRFLRFSIRRLLLLTGLVALLLYVLFIRPVTVAKEFIHTVQTADPKEISKYLNNMYGEAAHVECVLDERSWADVFSFRQTFVISVVRPDPESSAVEMVENHACCGTPFGVMQQESHVYVETREKKQ